MELTEYQQSLEKKKFEKEADWEWFTENAGAYMAHNFYVYHIISRIIGSNPQIRRIIELGTYAGAMTMQFGLEGVRKNIKVDTFDISDKLLAPDTKAILKHLGVNINLTDIFKNKEVVISLLSQEPCYLMCDNGNKKLEFQTFVPHLKSGSVVSVHDYEMEFFDEDAKMFEGKLEPIMTSEWKRHNAQFASWKVK